jgi:hypothetical protein
MGVVNDVQDTALFQRFATALFEETGLDLRGQGFDHVYAADVYAADLTGASAVDWP